MSSNSLIPCRTRALFLFTGLVTAMSAGCSGGDSLELVSVRGVVSMNGKPLSNARVIFQPVSGGRPSVGITDDEGNYQLLYVEGKMGALPGEHRVIVSTHQESDADSSDPTRQKGQPETVPPQFNQSTTLRATLEPGSSKDLDFPLTSSSQDIARS